MLMFIESINVERTATQRQSSRRVLHLCCDQPDCKIEFQKQYSKKFTERKRHFCSIKCLTDAQRVGGILHDEITAKIDAVCLERYGVRRPLQVKQFTDKRVKTCREKYGTDYPLMNEQCKQKARKTTFEHYGVEYCSQSNVIKEKVRSTNMAKIGVEWPAQSADVRNKAADKYFAQHGVRHQMQTLEMKEHFRYIQPEINRKRYNTLKKNGNLRKSLLEDAFYEYLSAAFGTENIVRWPRVNGWSIDFHVKSIDVYVQFDGEFWHGLDRPIEVISSSHRKIDKAILRTRLRDIEQTQWFKHNHMCLVRITDSEFKQKRKIGVLNEFIQRLSEYQS